MKYQAGSPVTDPVNFHFSFFILSFTERLRGQLPGSVGPCEWGAVIQLGQTK
jgi:hypothetical protein